MTEATPLDDRGRFTVKPEFRKLLGRRVVQILTPDGILIRPLSGKLPRGRLPSAATASGEKEGLREAGRRSRRR
ncbi:MAG TPA: hypothetical protein VI997_06995 [Candidatus Thermoplasmatota archaeon]|nr:hypothetical protein [Candidatus Thermoplasmatota archaeon]